MYPGPSFPYGSLIQPGLASQRHGLRPETQVPLGTDQSRSRLAWIVRPPLSHTYQTSDQVFSASTAQPVSQGIPIVQQNQYLPQRSQAYYSKPITQLHSYLEQPPHPQFSFLNGMATAIHVPQTSGHYLPPLNQPPPIARTQIIGKTRARNFETDPVPKKKKSRRICAEAGCKKYAQGATKRCVRHGGGRRCQTPDCTKSAAGSTVSCRIYGNVKLSFSNSRFVLLMAGERDARRQAVESRQYPQQTCVLLTAEGRDVVSPGARRVVEAQQVFVSSIQITV